MFKLYQNPPHTSLLPSALKATKANRRAVRAWKASRTEACAFFDEHPHRRHALFVARREDYVNLFPGDLDSAASRAWRSAKIVCAAQWIPRSTVVRLLFPVYQGPVRFAGTEAEARAIFDARWREWRANSGIVARESFWPGGTWREVTVQ